MNLNVIAALVVAVIGIAAACTLAALHDISGGEALSVVTLVLGGGVTFAGVHAGATASATSPTPPALPPASSSPVSRAN